MYTLEEVIKMCTIIQARQYLTKWMNELGIEGTIEMLNRNKDYPPVQIYFDLLREKGLYVSD